MADRILLRKLTFKSKLGFGNASIEELTVEEAIKLEHQFKLIEAYYNFSKISFTDEVLVKLGIPKEHWISKPGKNEELGRDIVKLLGIDEVKKKHKMCNKLLAKYAQSQDNFKIKSKKQYIKNHLLN